MGQNNPPIRMVEVLAERLRQIERARRPPGCAQISTGIAALDRLLPERSLHRGTLVEWLSAGEGAGAGTLALAVAFAACREGGALVVIDRRGEFYPPAAAARGINLNDTIVVWPDSAKDQNWALDQALRSLGVGAVLAWVERLEGRTFRRLQLAAEAGSGLGLLVRPARALREPSWAEVRLLVEPLRSVVPSPHQRLRVEVLRCRGAAGSAALELEINDETASVRVASQLAAPAPAHRSARA